MRVLGGNRKERAIHLVHVGYHHSLFFLPGHMCKPLQMPVNWVAVSFLQFLPCYTWRQKEKHKKFFKGKVIVSLSHTPFEGSPKKNQVDGKLKQKEKLATCFSLVNMVGGPLHCNTGPNNMLNWSKDFCCCLVCCTGMDNGSIITTTSSLYSSW